jgi:hypothetical protein
LECFNGDNGVVTVVLGRVREGSELECDEPLMEIAHPKAGGAVSQCVEVQGLVKGWR